MRAEAEAAIREYIEPLVRADGGRVELVEVRDRTVVLCFSGTCAGCPGHPYTMSGAVEPVLKRALGDDIVIEARFAP